MQTGHDAAEPAGNCGCMKCAGSGPHASGWGMGWGGRKYGAEACALLPRCCVGVQMCTDTCRPGSSDSGPSRTPLNASPPALHHCQCDTPTPCMYLTCRV
eukprot:351076-Chlamydomonas_euryale.AAC.1